MFRKILASVGLAAFLSSVPGAAAAEPRRLAPATPWQVDYADDSCRLARKFGEGDQSITLLMDRFQPGDEFRLSLIGHPLSRARPQQEIKLRFGSEGEQSAWFFPATTGDVPTLLVNGPLRIAPLTQAEEEARTRLIRRNQVGLFTPAPLGPERARAVETLQIAGAGITPVNLETGSLEAPLRAFDQCLDELISHWGLDAEKHRSLTRKVTPIGSPATWIKNLDYPTAALHAGQQAIVNFRLIVDPRGRVSDCKIQKATQGKGFEEVVCRAMGSRARFDPARDAEGNPVRSYFVGSVIFALPR